MKCDDFRLLGVYFNVAHVPKKGLRCNVSDEFATHLNRKIYTSPVIIFHLPCYKISYQYDNLRIQF